MLPLPAPLAWLQAVFACNAYIDAQAPWTLKKTDIARMGTVLYVLAETIRCVALLTQPIMPDASARILDLLAVPATAVIGVLLILLGAAANALTGVVDLQLLGTTYEEGVIVLVLGVYPQLVAKIGENIDQLLNVKLMTVNFLRRNPEVLRDIIKGMAVPELRFMVRIGALGFPFGVLLALWLSVIYYSSDEAREHAAGLGKPGVRCAATGGL